MNKGSKLMMVTSQELIMGRGELPYAQSASAQQPEDLTVAYNLFLRVVDAKRMVWGGKVFAVLPLVRCPPSCG